MSMSSWVSSVWRRFFAPPNPAGAGSAGRVPLRQEYDPEHALSAMGAFPPVIACIRARSNDLAGLPLIEVSRNGSVETVTKDSPALALLRRPSSRWSGLAFRQQLYTDFSATGNSFTERPAPNVLLRMHPKHCVYESDPLTGEPYAFKYGNRPVPLTNVVHVRSTSWTANLDMLYGESPIRSLDRVLDAITAAQDNMTNQAKRGRPDVVFSANTDEPIGDESIRRMASAWENFTKKGHGAFFAGHGLKADFLNLTPREMEFSSAEERAIAMVLMVLECPPARVFWGGGSAYGTDRQAMRTYWEALLKGMGALFEAEWTHHLLNSDGERRRIEHDQSNIEGLQVNRTERLTRVERWINVMGADPAEAARYEGFRGAPVGTPTGRSSRPIDRQPEEPQDERDNVRAGLAASLAGYLKGAAARYEARATLADGDVSRLTAGEEESIRVLVELERAGVPFDRAHELAADMAADTDEAVISFVSDGWTSGVTRQGLENLAAFSPERAKRVAARVS